MQQAKKPPAVVRRYTAPDLKSICIAVLGNRVTNSSNLDLMSFRSMIGIFNPGMPNCLKNASLTRCEGHPLALDHTAGLVGQRHISCYELVHCDTIDMRTGLMAASGSMCTPCFIQCQVTLGTLGYTMSVVDIKFALKRREKAEIEEMHVRRGVHVAEFTQRAVDARYALAFERAKPPPTNAQMDEYIERHGLPNPTYD